MCAPLSALFFLASSSAMRYGMGLVLGGMMRNSRMLWLTMDALEQPKMMPAWCSAQQPAFMILPLPSSSSTAVMDSACVSSTITAGSASLSTVASPVSSGSLMVISRRTARVSRVSSCLSIMNLRSSARGTGGSAPSSTALATTFSCASASANICLNSVKRSSEMGGCTPQRYDRPGCSRAFLIISTIRGWMELGSQAGSASRIIRKASMKVDRWMPT
mmetsp:Transcript_16605/g.41486  ORF Transcript_16605/g.41486 Transcript_16605/m.41486 type:complete len:218 (+) Transcript_16605:1904-2557(+)